MSQNAPPISKSNAVRTNKSESARLNAAQKNTVRTMLATGATIAVVISAQAMALFDRSSTASDTAPAVASSSASNAVSLQPTTAVTVIAQPTAQPVVQAAVSQPQPVTRSSRR